MASYFFKTATHLIIYNLEIKLNYKISTNSQWFVKAYYIQLNIGKITH